MSKGKLNRYELARQFNVHEDIARTVCKAFNEDEEKVKSCLSNKDEYLKICRIEKWRKQLSPEDFNYIQTLSEAEATQFARKKSLERKYGSLENFYKDQDSKRKETLQKRYGRQTSFDPEKCKQTKLEKYGDKNYSNHTQAVNTRKNLSIEAKEAIKEKRENTLLERYGSKNYRNVEKWKETLEHNFGSFENYSKLRMQKVKQTKLERYGNENYTNTKKALETRKNWSEEYKQSLRKRIAETNKKRYGVSCPFLALDKFIIHPNHISSTEKQLKDFIETLGLEIINNSKSVIKISEDHPLELDIFIPSKNVAIEYDGLYWHSEVYKPNNYHQLKSDLCREKGIRLIHIFGDDWQNKRPICESIIKSSLGIYDRKIFARKCTIKDIDSKTYKLFLNENHIQGAVNSSIRKGLFYDDELVQVIGLGKSRFKKDELELHRMCSKLNTQVLGGFSKLLHNLTDIKEFITYVDLALFDGKGYEASGFEFLGKTKPNYWYLDKGCTVRISRQKCQKHKLKTFLGESFDPNLTELQNMHKAGYVRFFDSGTEKLIWKNKKFQK